MKSSVKFWPLLLVALAAVALVAGAATRADAGCADVQYVGEICTFAFGYCPDGFVEAAGQLLPISKNQALFSLLGTTFGGDGVANFGVPDLRGAIVAGTGSAPGLPSIDLGQTGGGANTVSVVAADPPDGVPVPTTQLPSLGLMQCIATVGVFPTPN